MKRSLRNRGAIQKSVLLLLLDQNEGSHGFIRVRMTIIKNQVVFELLSISGWCFIICRVGIQMAHARSELRHPSFPTKV
jgi:hypothetical protein